MEEAVVQGSEKAQTVEGKESAVLQASQDDHYSTAIDNSNETVQLGQPVRKPLLSHHFRVPTIKVGCLSFTKCFQEYLQQYWPPSHLQHIIVWYK